MDAVNFLNLEYLLLRAYEIVVSFPVVTGTYNEITAPASNTVRIVAHLLGTFALIGMGVTLALFVLVVWVKIRLEMVEHEGFKEKESEHHLVPPAEAEGSITAAPKNARWERVRELANTANESDWRLAILEADIMLNDLLREQGYRGESIGERLRDANPLQFSTLDLAWQAHKVRNDIAHAGEGFHLSQREANATIDLYRRVFEEFNYI